MRRRVAELPNVALQDRCDAVGLLADAAGATGSPACGCCAARRAAPPRTLPADLVVAATGRAARLAAWLEELGYRAPGRAAPGRRHRLRQPLPLRLPAGALGADKLVLIGRPAGPAALRSGLFAQEDGRWLLSGRAAMPVITRRASSTGLIRFAASVAPLDVDGRAARRRAARRDRLVPVPGQPAALLRAHARGRPAGLVPLGDAICAFNPIYGQGMSVAAGQALALLDCRSRPGPSYVERRYLSAAAKNRSTMPGQLTASADLASALS